MTKRVHKDDSLAADTALYIRVSTEEQADTGVSIEQQTARLIGYCTAHGLKIGVIFREVISASKPLADRPGGGELLELVSRGAVKSICALKLDRLFRDTVDCLNHVLDWDKSGIAFHLVDQGGQSINSGSAMGRAMLTVMAMFGELERGLIAERVAAAMQHLKSNLRPYTLSVYGYNRKDDKLVKNSAEQKIIRKIQRQFQDGVSLREIARQLNTGKIASKRGGKWYASTVRYILQNELHAA